MVPVSGSCYHTASCILTKVPTRVPDLKKGSIFKKNLINLDECYVYNTKADSKTDVILSTVMATAYQFEDMVGPKSSWDSQAMMHIGVTCELEWKRW